MRGWLRRTRERVSRRLGRLPFAVKLVGVAILGGAAALALLGVTSRSSGEVGPGTVELRAFVGPPRTEFRLPPFGVISAPTHRTPVTVAIRVDRIDVDAVQELAAGPRVAERLEADIRADLDPLVTRFAVRSIGLSVVVGGIVGALVPRRRWASVAAGAAGGLIASAGFLGLAWWRFDATSFADRPRFEGPLERVPALLETAGRYVEDFEDVRDRVEALSGQLGDLYGAATTEELARGPGSVHILHVSDLHLNPVGLEVVRDLAERFDVDAVVDTGDFTTFGLPPEARFSDNLAGITVPYYLIPGNHDAFGIRQSLSQNENLTVVDGTEFSVRGVDIVGIGHPVFTATNEVSDDVLEASLAHQAEENAALVERLRPDVVAVHDPRQADGADVPLVIGGHLHETTYTERDDGGLVLTVGSTGATGLGSFTVDTELPYEAEVLHFSGGRLVGIDAISLRTSGDFEIERRLIPDPEDQPGDATAAPARRASSTNRSAFAGAQARGSLLK
jgi:predicted phosphodiesterase